MRGICGDAALGTERPDYGSEHFELLSKKRNERQRWPIRFLEWSRRTSLRHRGWFQISDIAPDPAARQRLVGLWRASIYSGDLEVGGKSQVLCLSASPLAEGWRLPRELARGEHFNMIVDDLWMSASRWLDWFNQVGESPPNWLRLTIKKQSPGGLSQGGKPSWKTRPGKRKLTPSEMAVVRAPGAVSADGILDHKAKARNRLINEHIVKDQKKSAVSSRTIERTIAKVHFV
jgi:hypothetical protein